MKALIRHLLLFAVLAMLLACETPTIPTIPDGSFGCGLPTPTPIPTPIPTPFPETGLINYPNPTVENPPDAGAITIFGTAFALEDFGYEQTEYFYGGTANSWVNTEDMGPDGKWKIAPAASAEYKTRMVIYRPADMSKFNGTVVMEWLNVTGGVDTAADWAMMHTEIIRSNYIYVGISAQSIGIEGGKTPIPTPTGMTMPLKNLAPRRYKSLSHPGDSFSYDMFAQAAQAIRHPQGISPLGGAQVDRLIAAGESQSAFRLVTFINAFGKRTDLFDGYFLHSRLGYREVFGGASGPLSESPQQEIFTPGVVYIRDDIDKPVIDVQTEADLFVLGSYENRQPDNENFRLWEIAGAAHADYYTMSAPMMPKLDEKQADIIITKRAAVIIKCDDNLSSAPQHHFVIKAALVALNTWIKDGVAPPTAEPISVTNGKIDRDSFGNALGGVRSPYMDVPIATLSGENGLQDLGADSPSICFLFGTTEMFDNATLRSLYANSSDYVQKVTASAAELVDAKFLLAADAEIIIEAAEKIDIP